MVVAPVREFDEIGTGGLRAHGAVGRAGAGLASRAVQIGERIERCHRPEGLTVIVLDACDGAGVRIHRKLHGPTGQFIGHLEHPALVTDRAVLAHEAGYAVMEDGIDLTGQHPQGPDTWQVLLVARKRCGALQAVMGMLVVKEFGPGPQARV